METLTELLIYFTLLLHLFPERAGCLAPPTLPASRGRTGPGRAARCRLHFGAAAAGQQQLLCLKPELDGATNSQGSAATVQVPVCRSSVCQDKDTRRAQCRWQKHSRRSECLYKWNNSRAEWRVFFSTLLGQILPLLYSEVFSISLLSRTIFLLAVGFSYQVIFFSP